MKKSCRSIKIGGLFCCILFLILFSSSCRHAETLDKPEFPIVFQDNFKIIDLLSTEKYYNFWGAVILNGNDYYLVSGIVGNEKMKWCKFLGRNILIDDFKDGLHIDNGRLKIGYCINPGNKDLSEWFSASVPFGCFFGSTYESDFPFNSRTSLEISDKYGQYPSVYKEEDSALESFVPTVVQYLKDDNADAMAELFIYPISLQYIEDGYSYPVILENADDFKKYYGRIFTERIKSHILEYNNEDINIHPQGIRIGRGVLPTFYVVILNKKAYIKSFAYL